MTTEKDSRLVDYLYDELSEEEAEAFERSLESDEALSSEVAGLGETLETLRKVEAEDPSPHLDSLILAHARQVADETNEKRGWFRKLLASPLAGLVAAGSVAMIAALIAVPSMILETSEQAPRAVEQIPSASPVVTKETEALEDEEELKPTDAPLADPAPEPADDESAAPKKKSRKRQTVARPQSPKPAKQEEKTALKLDELAGEADGFGDRSAGADTRSIAPAQPPAPIEAPPAPPAVVPPRPKAVAKAEPRREAAKNLRADAKDMTSEAEGSEDQLAKTGAIGEAQAEERKRADDEAQREERGRAMLAAASAEFKRNNPVGGREILVRALAVVRGAPVHAEIAFRLAQHDLARGAHREAVYYARIAASAAKFDKRTAAMDIVVEAERRLAEEQSMDELAPAAPTTQPPATDADESAR